MSKSKKYLLPIALSVVAICLSLLLLLRNHSLEADIFSDEQITVDGTSRLFRLVIPHSLPNPAPVLFAFHGIGDSAQSMAKYSRLDRLAAQNGFILVYPTARQSMWATMKIEMDWSWSSPRIVRARIRV